MFLPSLSSLPAYFNKNYITLRMHFMGASMPPLTQTLKLFAQINNNITMNQTDVLVAYNLADCASTLVRRKSEINGATTSG